MVVAGGSKTPLPLPNAKKKALWAAGDLVVDERGLVHVNSVIGHRVGAPGLGREDFGREVGWGEGESHGRFFSLTAGW